MTEEQQKIADLEEQVSKLTDTITDLMDVIHNHYQLKSPYNGGDTELFEIIKNFQGE